MRADADPASLGAIQSRQRAEGVGARVLHRQHSHDPFPNSLVVLYREVSYQKWYGTNRRTALVDEAHTGST